MRELEDAIEESERPSRFEREVDREQEHAQWLRFLSKYESLPKWLRYTEVIPGLIPLAMAIALSQLLRSAFDEMYGRVEFSFWGIVVYGVVTQAIWMGSPAAFRALRLWREMLTGTTVPKSYERRPIG